MLMVSHKNYNLSVDEGFVLYPTSKLITRFIEGFTLGMKSQSISYILNESEHIHWILDLEGDVHLRWDLWISGLQKCKGNGFFEVGRAGKSFQSGLENLDFFLGLPESTSPKEVRGEGGCLTSTPFNLYTCDQRLGGGDQLLHYI